MNLKQLENRYAEFVPPCADTVDGNEIGDAKAQECLWGAPKAPIIKVTDKGIDECIGFMNALSEASAEIRSLICSLLQEDSRIQDMLRGMCYCFPSEYDGEILLLAYDFVPVFIEKNEHWIFRHVDRKDRKKYKNAYIYAKDLWQRMTKTIESHNFSIGSMDNGTEVSFYFTVYDIPGRFEIHLPIGSNQRENPSMQIRVSYAMATCEDVWNTIGRAYHIDEVAALLKSFVDSEGYKEYLPKGTIEHKDNVNGQEISWSEPYDVPQSIWDAIELSRKEACIEKGPIID